MLYHNRRKCRANGGAGYREFGFPLVCTLHEGQPGAGRCEMQCPACGRVWRIADDAGVYPADVEDERKYLHRLR